MKTYEITFNKSKEIPAPTDFFHLPAGFELRNMTCTHNTTRSEKWEYEIEDADAGRFEYAAQNCRTTSSFREVKEQIYTVLSTSGWQGDHWEIAGTFDSATKAATFRTSIRTNDARERGYITAIVRSNGKPCLLHSGDCWIFNLTSKKYRNFDRHLRGTVHAQCPPEAV